MASCVGWLSCGGVQVQSGGQQGYQTFPDDGADYSHPNDIDD
jgi:hypothetical protein